MDETESAAWRRLHAAQINLRLRLGEATDADRRAELIAEFRANRAMLNRLSGSGLGERATGDNATIDWRAETDTPDDPLD